MNVCVSLRFQAFFLLFFFLFKPLLLHSCLNLLFRLLHQTLTLVVILGPSAPSTTSSLGGGRRLRCHQAWPEMQVNLPFPAGCPHCRGRPTCPRAQISYVGTGLINERKLGFWSGAVSSSFRMLRIGRARILQHNIAKKHVRSHWGSTPMLLSDLSIVAQSSNLTAIDTLRGSCYWSASHVFSPAHRILHDY